MHPQSNALRQLAEKWANVPAGELANSQSYLTELAMALGVAPPRPRGSGYEFEYTLPVIDRSGRAVTIRIDLYRAEHFILEAKDTGGGSAAEKVLRGAYAQAKGYAGEVPHGPPPYLLVLDVGRTLLAWDRWAGTYGGFALARRFDLATLWQRPDDIELLRAIWEKPASLDPRGRAAAVTREVAARLAELSALLEARGFEQERVARFLMRCVFTMFAEDVELLPEKPFQTAVQQYGENPAEFAEVMAELWKSMDEGRRFGMRKLLRFNGHFFHDAEVLPLTRDDLAVLLRAAKADWREVEPTIFGTLLTRALDAEERHRLGAEYTPREYVERVVRQTVDVPVRERWGATLAEAMRLRERGKKKEREAAERLLRDFLVWLRGLRFLDPACGSGNFLYVTLHTVKRIELEVLHEIEQITGHPELPLEDVGPAQFHGIEVKPWAREIAELTLWIGYHQFRLTHFKGGAVPEPVLKDTGTLELRDAVLEWDDERVEVPEKSRLDPTPRIKHPVTGKLVPDPNARLPYYEYRGARQALWPQADFIVGNPPYMGQYRMRESFGDGYVDALRAGYPELPDSADYVMYWWSRAASAVAKGQTVRSGLITTNTITQKQNRVAIEAASSHGAHIVWAVADHPWIEAEAGAAVRVAMTVMGQQPGEAVLVVVDETGNVIREVASTRLNADLSTHADVPGAAAVPLAANKGLATPGVKLHGAGFILTPDEALAIRMTGSHYIEVVKRYLNGKDLNSRPRGVYVIDFALMEEDAARLFPLTFDIVRDRVKPERDANKREGRKTYWWRFGEPNQKLRSLIAGLPRYIATSETSKHRFFTFLDSDVAPDNMLVCVGTTECFHLGILSSRLHTVWAVAAGGRLGVGNDPRYNKSLCFDPFPFPDPTPDLRVKIGEVAERLDEHRKAALARDERVTMTGMYNVVEKLRSGEALTPKERDVHQIAACGVLRDLHDELDRLVAEAYGWPWPMEREAILERLVSLHDERVEEERRGLVRWLRPEYQIPRFGRGGDAGPAAELALADADATPAAPAERRPWPAGAVEQITALMAQVAAASATAEEAAAAFDGAPPALVRQYLDALVMAGEVRLDPDSGRFAPVAEPL
ncbi:MAG TPA: DNA methyltransferase [Longimicrobium sp.]